MLEVETPAAMADYAGKKLGSSDWVLIDQAMIHRFADVTGDHQWIHVDTERARREMPGGKTIAHGFLTLSLLPRLSDTVYSIRKRSRGINYGANKVRFTAPVPSGSRIRLHQTLKAAEPVAGGQKLIFESTVEVEGQARPALFAETIVAVYD